MVDTFINHSRSTQWLQAPRELLQDQGLTYEAAGLLLYLLSKPANWRVIPVTLIRPNSGRDKVYRILSELIQARYVERFDWTDDSGRPKFSNYHIYDERQPGDMPKHRQKLSSPDPGVPPAIYPVTEKPFPEKPDLVKPDITYKREKQTTDQTYISPVNGELATGDDLSVETLSLPTLEHESTNEEVDSPSFEVAETAKNGSAVKSTPNTENRPKTPRKRDQVYDAVCEFFYKRQPDDPTLKGARGQGKLIGVTTGRIKQFDPDITGEEIAAAAKHFFGQYPDIKCVYDADKIISKIEQYRAFQAQQNARKASTSQSQGGVILSPQSARAAQNNPRNMGIKQNG